MCYLSNVENRSPVFYHALRCGIVSAASTFYDDFVPPDYTTLKVLDNKDLSFKRSRTSQLSDPLGSYSLSSKIISPQFKEVLNMRMFEFYANLVQHSHTITSDRWWCIRPSNRMAFTITILNAPSSWALTISSSSTCTISSSSTWTKLT